MDRWQKKVAVVTGASSGIGAAVVKDLIKAGLIVVGLARREERMRELRAELPADQQSRLHTIRCDVSNEEDVKTAFAWVDQNLGGTDILVNNAGISRRGVSLTTPDNTIPMKEVLDINVMGVLFCVREAYNSMKRRNFDGHVVIVNSILGHKVMNFMGNKQLPSSNMYSPSKYAVTAMTETYRQEFANDGTKVKITSISPGVTDTEILSEKLRSFNLPMLRAEDISDAILYVIGTPPNVQVHELTIKPVGEPM